MARSEILSREMVSGKMQVPIMVVIIKTSKVVQVTQFLGTLQFPARMSMLFEIGEK